MPLGKGPPIRVLPLGAGQDVGRSCILVQVGGRNVMLDCGMHMGFNDERRYPDFSIISGGGSLTDSLDCVLVSHFHLDHCGALPYMTEIVGYDGPIFMSQPTKAIAPILLEDMRKIMADKSKSERTALGEPKEDKLYFTSEMIKNCMSKVRPVTLHESVQVAPGLEIKAYYAGHVLGAVMFHVKAGDQSVLYTGDYNMTPNRHLGAAWVDRCRPDLLITESTYATTIRDSKRCRERDFLKKVHRCVDAGGKVLIPVFALGRAQELCILLETYWERMALTCPIYYAMGLTQTATDYYKMFTMWTNQKIRDTFVEHNLFNFKHISPFDRSVVDMPGPMVVFATPGMLHSGLSLWIFRRWASDPKNVLIMPGYCVAGTVGAKVLAGAKRVEMPDGHQVDVKLAVQYMSFSAHADAKGIMQLIRQCEPRAVMLVHGEADRMQFLSEKIRSEFGVNCYMPANGEQATIPIKKNVTATFTNELNMPLVDVVSGKKRPMVHCIVAVKDKVVRLMSKEEAEAEIARPFNNIKWTVATKQTKSSPQTLQDIRSLLERTLDPAHEVLQSSADNSLVIDGGVYVKMQHVTWLDSHTALGKRVVELLSGGRQL